MDSLSPASYPGSRRSSRSSVCSVGSGDYEQTFNTTSSSTSKAFDIQTTVYLNNSKKKITGEEYIENVIIDINDEEEDNDESLVQDKEEDEQFDNKEEENYEKSAERATPSPSPSCKMFNKEDKLSDIIKELDDISIFEFNEAFDLFDLNNDGVISHSDLKNTFISLGERPTDEEITRMLNEAPKPLDMEGFIKLMACRTLQLDSEAVMTAAISKWDPLNTGLVSLAKLKHELMSHGERFTEDEVKNALEQAPVTIVRGRSMVQYQPLCKAICGVRRSQY